jgi:hypothetical protein
MRSLTLSYCAAALDAALGGEPAIAAEGACSASAVVFRESRARGQGVLFEHLEVALLTAPLYPLALRSVHRLSTRVLWKAFDEVVPPLRQHLEHGLISCTVCRLVYSLKMNATVAGYSAAINLPHVCACLESKIAE